MRSEQQREWVKCAGECIVKTDENQRRAHCGEFLFAWLLWRQISFRWFKLKLHTRTHTHTNRNTTIEIGWTNKRHTLKQHNRNQSTHWFAHSFQMVMLFECLRLSDNKMVLVVLGSYKLPSLPLFVRLTGNKIVYIVDSYNRSFVCCIVVGTLYIVVCKN